VPEAPFSLAVVPHAPLLLPTVAGPGDPCAGSRAAASSLLADFGSTTFIVVSPHAERTGVYAEARGDLSRFGIPGVVISAEASRVSGELAPLWSQPALDGPVDHGALVPMALAPEGSRFICCGIAESATADGSVAIGIALARAVHSLDWDMPVTFIASAHTAASLSPRAPLMERPEGQEFDAAVVGLLREGPSRLAESDSIPSELWARGGSCSRGPLAALGELARLCGVDTFEILSHEWPVGVGLVVARGNL